MANLIQNVEIMCKTQRKSMRKSIVNLCEKLSNPHFCTTKSTFSHIFPHFFTGLLTTFPSLYHPNLFHFFTPPYYYYDN